MTTNRIILFFIIASIGASLEDRSQQPMMFNHVGDISNYMMRQPNIQVPSLSETQQPLKTGPIGTPYIIGPQPYFMGFQPSFLMPFFYQPQAVDGETAEVESSEFNDVPRVWNSKQGNTFDAKQFLSQLMPNSFYRAIPHPLVAATKSKVNVNTRGPSVNAPQRYPYYNQSLATQCNIDVCKLPECFCGGDAVPGKLPVRNVPQLVLLTFDDGVNDRNRDLYADLFQNGRTNPNGCPISATFYVSHEWTDYSLVHNLYAAGHEIASHTISHSFGQEFTVKQWAEEAAGQRDLLAAYAGVRVEDVRGMRAPYLSIGGDNMFKMLHDANFTYDSSMPIIENKVPAWPYTLDHKMPHECVIPPCPVKSYPGVWEIPMVMWDSLGDRDEQKCSMGDDCYYPDDPYFIKMTLMHNFERHYKSNRAPFPLYFHSTWFEKGQNYKEGFKAFLDEILNLDDVWMVTSWQALQWIRDPTPLTRIHQFKPFQCSYPERPVACQPEEVQLCKTLHKSDVRYFRVCGVCPNFYPWTGKTGIANENLESYINSQE